MHFVTSSARLQSTGTLYTTPIPYVTTKGDTDRPNAHKKPIISITLYTPFSERTHTLYSKTPLQTPVFALKLQIVKNADSVIGEGKKHRIAFD